MAKLDQYLLGEIAARLARVAARFKENPRVALRSYYRRIYWRLSDWPVERFYGVRTSEILLALSEAGLGANRYEPIPFVTLRAIARHMRRKRIRAPLFVDIGCGLGRPLYYFAARFEELIGFELAEDVAALGQARLEVAKHSHPLYRKISLLHADATRSVPLDRDMVIFMYNPFGAETMRQLCQHLLQRSSGNLHIYYANPHEVKVMDEMLTPHCDRLEGFFDVAYFSLNRAADAG